MDQPPPRPTTDRLFDTAAELFCHKGYAATTTREIATAVGIQQASLYHHMASKEDLVYKICRSSLEQFLADVPAAVDQVACPLERVRVFIRAHLATLLRYQKRNVTMLTELRAISSRHRAEVLALRQKYERFVRSIIENAQTAGMIRDDVPAKYLSLALLSILNHAALWFRKDQALLEDQLAGVFTKVFLEGAATGATRSAVALPDLGQTSRNPPRMFARNQDPRRTLLSPARWTRRSGFSLEKVIRPPALVKLRLCLAFRKLRCTTTSAAKKIFCI
jgi:TetR/AcrR family transcriptional regulator, cholesterol catabolism regulator